MKGETTLSEWDRRSKTYKDTEWANRYKYREEIINALELNGNEVVLDLGTGTGKIAGYLKGKVKEIYGLDISNSMMSNYEVKGVKLCLSDCRNMSIFEDNKFDIIIARMLFHHLDDFGISRTMNEIERILKPDGKFLLAEGIPPNYGESKERFTEIFKLKEERQTFMIDDLTKIVGKTLKVKKIRVFSLEQICINNWLDSCNLPQETKYKILQMILDPRYPVYQKEHNQKIAYITDKPLQVYMDFMHCLVVGEKIK